MMQPQIVHEAEVHRQHVRLKIPIHVEIDGVRYQVDDWSMGGFGIESEITSRQPGERFAVKITFPFEDFEVGMRLDCQIVYVVSDSRRFGCRFIGLSRDQLALFRYLVDAYLSGEVVSAGDILAVRGRDNTAEARIKALAADPLAEEDTLARKFRRYGGMAALGLAGLILVGVIAVGIQERYFTLEASTAVVEAPIYRLRAPVGGLLQPANTGETVQVGARLASIRVLDGTIVPMESPCVCNLVEWMTLAGQYVQEGEHVVALVAADRPLTVRAEVPLAALQRLQQGDRALIRLPGRGETVAGQIERIDTRPQIAQLTGEAQGPVARNQAQVTIRPDVPFELDDLGSLVTVRFP